MRTLRRSFRRDSSLSSGRFDRWFWPRRSCVRASPSRTLGARSPHSAGEFWLSRAHALGFDTEESRRTRPCVRSSRETPWAPALDGWVNTESWPSWSRRTDRHARPVRGVTPFVQVNPRTRAAHSEAMQRCIFCARTSSARGRGTRPRDARRADGLGRTNRRARTQVYEVHAGTSNSDLNPVLSKDYFGSTGTTRPALTGTCGGAPLRRRVSPAAGITPSAGRFRPK